MKKQKKFKKVVEWDEMVGFPNYFLFLFMCIVLSPAFLIGWIIYGIIKSFKFLSVNEWRKIYWVEIKENSK